jgi:hypothetical protein
MKTNAPDDDPALSRLLREWECTAESLPPRFEERVWQRIAHAEPPVATNLRTVFREWLDARLRRPAMALACVAVLMSTGLTTGYLHARSDAAQARQESQMRYLQSVNPFLH